MQIHCQDYDQELPILSLFPKLSISDSLLIFEMDSNCKGVTYWRYQNRSFLITNLYRIQTVGFSAKKAKKLIISLIVKVLTTVSLSFVDGNI